ncbi:glycosyltransferase family 2 protein [Acetatifactor muris]|jgi:glycosyltransferase involved in cell wall biosynthesis|uniref:glycosyltransferase family 2 protein n=1 Tax=Acetatifactor muris TaxID=879566 RepID=UPI0023F251DE|nr:glycosyltransferase [Acetatifactor muris]
MFKVSVIVPCLNMRKYIEDCLESIVNQTLTDLEIMVIDAGSTDGTLEILNKFMKRDGRIYLMHSEKKSYGYQVNLGIQHASGQYVAIVDADDRIAPDMYEVLYEKAVCSGADYVKGTAKGFYTISDDLTYYMPLMQFPRREYQNGLIEVIPAERTDLLTRDNFLWYGIFEHKFMKNISLHESPGAAFQDLGGLLQTQMRARKAVYLEEAFYEYRQDNVTSSTYNPKGFQFVWEEYTWAEQFITNASDNWKTAFYRKLFLHTSSIYTTMTATGQVWVNSREYVHLIREKLRNKLEENILKKDNFSEDEWEDLQLLIEDESRLYKKYLNMHLRRQQQLILIKNIAVNKKIVIFGYGNAGTFVYAQIRKHGLGTVVAFCDNQAEKQELLYNGISIMNPTEAVDLYPDACFVITSSRGLDAIEKQLISMKISRNQICAYTSGVDMRLFGALIV